MFLPNSFLRSRPTFCPKAPRYPSKKPPSLPTNERRGFAFLCRRGDSFTAGSQLRARWASARLSGPLFLRPILKLERAAHRPFNGVAEADNALVAVDHPRRSLAVHVCLVDRGHGCGIAHRAQLLARLTQRVAP